MPKTLTHLKRARKAWRDITGRQSLPENAAEIIALHTLPAELAEAAGNATLNAELAPDPRMDGATDVYLVPVEDIDALRAALALYEGKP